MIIDWYNYKYARARDIKNVQFIFLYRVICRNLQSRDTVKGLKIELL